MSSNSAQRPDKDEQAEYRAPDVAGARLGPIGAWGARTFASLAVKNFRLFFMGHGLSLVGTWVRRTAMGWLVYQLTGSMSLLGIVMGLALAPMFFLSPLAGSIADHVDKRRLIILTQIVASISTLLIAALIWVDVIEVWHIMVLAVISGSAFAFEVPARQAFVVEMVGRDHLRNAIALNSALVNGARIVGPALAGIIMEWLGMAMCFAIDGASYLIVILTLLAMRLPKFKLKPRTVSQFELLMEGAREVWNNRPVRLVISLLLITGVFGWSFQTLMPAIAQDVLMLSEREYGVLMAMFGVGAIFGALFTAGRSDDINTRKPLFAGVWLMVGGVLMIACVRSYYAMMPGLLLAGFGGILFLSTGNTMVQLNVGDHIRGRVMGIWALAFGGSLPLGSFLAGGLAEALSTVDGKVLAAGLPAQGAGGLLRRMVLSFSNGGSAFVTIAILGLILCLLSALVYRVLGRQSFHAEPIVKPA